MPDLNEEQEAQARKLALTTPLSLAASREEILAREEHQQREAAALDMLTVAIVPNRADRRRAARERRRG